MMENDAPEAQPPRPQAANDNDGAPAAPIDARILTIARALGRPALVPVPAAALRLAMGEASEIVLSSQRVVPAEAERRGFRFRFPSLEGALADLSRAHGDIRNLVERLDVMRWGHAMIRPRTGFMWGQARREAAKPYRSIYFAHSELSGVALFEEAFDHGVRTADILAADLHR